MKSVITILICMSIFSVKSQGPGITATGYSISEDSLTVKYTVTETIGGFKIKTDYPFIYDSLLTRRYLHYSCERKHDRGGEFYRYVFYFDVPMKAPIISYLNNITK